MAHDTHHKGPKENKSVISFKNSFWLVIIIVGLFIAALNFIQAESGGEEHAADKTEAAGSNAANKANEAHEMQAAPATESESTKTEAPKLADTPVKEAEGKQPK